MTYFCNFKWLLVHFKWFPIIFYCWIGIRPLKTYLSKSNQIHLIRQYSIVYFFCFILLLIDLLLLQSLSLVAIVWSVLQMDLTKVFDKYKPKTRTYWYGTYVIDGRQIIKNFLSGFAITNGTGMEWFAVLDYVVQLYMYVILNRERVLNNVIHSNWNSQSVWFSFVEGI